MEEIEQKRLDRARFNYVLLHSTDAMLYMIVVILLGWTGLPLLYLKAYGFRSVLFLFFYYFVQMLIKIFNSAMCLNLALIVESTMIIMVLYKLLLGSTIKNRLIWLPEENKK